MKKFPVRIYAVNVRPLRDGRLFETAYRKVTEERRKKTDQMRSCGDKCRSLGAELLLLYGLSQLDFSAGVYCDPKPGSVTDSGAESGSVLMGSFVSESLCISAESTSEREQILSGTDLLPAAGQDGSCFLPDMKFPRFRYGENGKPYLDGVRDLYFNMSHSEELAVCAVAPCEVGCDVEKIRDRNQNIARRFFTPAEYETISSLTNEKDRQRMFYRFWTLKESFLKVTGRGLGLGLNSFQINLDRENPSVIQNVDHRKYSFKEYEAAEDYCCAVCAVQETFEAQVRRVSMEELLG